MANRVNTRKIAFVSNVIIRFSIERWWRESFSRFFIFDFGEFKKIFYQFWFYFYSMPDLLSQRVTFDFVPMLRKILLEFVNVQFSKYEWDLLVNASVGILHSKKVQG